MCRRTAERFTSDLLSIELEQRSTDLIYETGFKPTIYSKLEVPLCKTTNKEVGFGPEPLARFEPDSEVSV